MIVFLCHSCGNRDLKQGKHGKKCQISEPDLDFKVELLKLRGYYLGCRKTERTKNITTFVLGFLLGFISKCTSCPLGQMPVSAIQLDKTILAVKSKKKEPSNHQMKHFI